MEAAGRKPGRYISHDYTTSRDAIGGVQNRGQPTSTEFNLAELIFPIDSAESFFRNLSGNVERIGNTLRWPSYDGMTEFSVERIDQPTPDGLVVSEMVTLQHISPSLQSVSPSLAGYLNTWATLSSFLPAGAVAPSRLISKIGVFSTDREAAERVYAPLICMEAGVIGWHAARLSRGQFQMDPAQSPLSMTDQAPPFDSADFEAIKSLTDKRGFMGSLGELHFTVEFPWDAGAISNVFAHDDAQEALIERGVAQEDVEQIGGRTSLLQLLVMEHPLYGKGVQCRLEIPYSVDGLDAVQLVDELNRWELSGTDLPPLLGAWCLGGRAPAFVTFVPTQLCFAGLLHNLAVWGIVRHFRVREWLSGAENSSQ